VTVDADGALMSRALAQAVLAAEEQEVPVGAVVAMPDGSIVEEHNRTRQSGDPTAHAEILALREAARRLRDWRLVGCVLYVTLEPCAMCAGAIVLARVPRVVFAAPDPKAGFCGSLGDLVRDDRLNHRVELESGVLADESARLLRSFFEARR
jgi:tRNA(adenine34) deaminase